MAAERRSTFGIVATEAEAVELAPRFPGNSVILELKRGSSLPGGEAEVIGYLVWPKVIPCPCCHREGENAGARLVAPGTYDIERPAADVTGAPV